MFEGIFFAFFVVMPVLDRTIPASSEIEIMKEGWIVKTGIPSCNFWIPDPAFPRRFYSR